MTKPLAWVTDGEYAEWFRRGVPRYEYIWPKDARGVANNRWVNVELIYAGEAGEAPIGYSRTERKCLARRWGIGRGDNFRRT
jgi:hypothetical protein